MSGFDMELFPVDLARCIGTLTWHVDLARRLYGEPSAGWKTLVARIELRSIRDFGRGFRSGEIRATMRRTKKTSRQGEGSTTLTQIASRRTAGHDEKREIRHCTHLCAGQA